MHTYVYTYVHACVCTYVIVTGPAKRENWAQTTRNRKTVNILGSAR